MTRRETIELGRGLKAMREGAPDDLASKAPYTYPTMKYNGAKIPVGTRINWKGRLKRAATDLWDREDQNPDNHSNGWHDLDYRNGYRIIPSAPNGVFDAALAFNNGDCGWWGEALYRSILPTPNNYTPEAYPAGWERTEE